MPWLVRVIGLCLFVLSMLHGLSRFANAQLWPSDCEPGPETIPDRLHGKVKEIREVISDPGSGNELLRVQKFDEFGKKTEADEGIGGKGTAKVKWQSRSVHVYDELARLVSITKKMVLVDPLVQLECAFGYSNFGDLALVVRSNAKSFAGASIYVHESGKLVKEITYDPEGVLPAHISTFEYDTGMRTTERRVIGSSRYTKRTYNERGETVKFEAYEKNTLFAYETSIYSEGGDLIETAHYYSNGVLAWRDLIRYEHDQVGNWISRDYSETREKGSEVGVTKSRTIRTITYYSP